MSARERLVESGIELFSTKGYEATSPGRIQEAAGVGQGSFYHHFKSKADLGTTALQELADEMCAAFDELGVTGDLARGYLEIDRDALKGCRIGRIAMEAAISDVRIQRPVASYFAHVREGLSSYFAAQNTAIPPDQLADLAVAVVQGGYVLARATGDSGAQRSAIDALLALLDELPQGKEQA